MILPPSSLSSALCDANTNGVKPSYTHGGPRNASESGVVGSPAINKSSDRLRIVCGSSRVHEDIKTVKHLR